MLSSWLIVVFPAQLVLKKNFFLNFRFRRTQVKCNYKRKHTQKQALSNLLHTASPRGPPREPESWSPEEFLFSAQQTPSVLLHMDRSPRSQQCRVLTVHCRSHSELSRALHLPLTFPDTEQPKEWRLDNVWQTSRQTHGCFQVGGKKNRETMQWRSINAGVLVRINRK